MMMTKSKWFLIFNQNNNNYYYIVSDSESDDKAKENLFDEDPNGYIEATPKINVNEKAASLLQ